MLIRNLIGPKSRDFTIHVSDPVTYEQDWVCEYWTDGWGTGLKRRAFGVDPIQAVILALTYLATNLYASDDFKRGEITWGHGQDRFDLGLPVADTIRRDVAHTIRRLKLQFREDEF